MYIWTGWHVFYKASMQLELFSIQKIVIINSIHDREFELRNDEYLRTKKSLQETQWVERFSEEAFVFYLFVCLFGVLQRRNTTNMAQSWILTYTPTRFLTHS